MAQALRSTPGASNRRALRRQVVPLSAQAPAGYRATRRKWEATSRAWYGRKRGPQGGRLRFVTHSDCGAAATPALAQGSVDDHKNGATKWATRVSHRSPPFRGSTEPELRACALPAPLRRPQLTFFRESPAICWRWLVAAWREIRLSVRQKYIDCDAKVS